MSIKIVVHELNLENESAVVTLTDDGHVLIFKKSMAVKLNEEGTSIDTDWFNDINSVGICGATSTPRWLMENVQNTIENIS